MTFYALNMLRTDIVYRRDIFDRGLRAAGYSLTDEHHKPKKDDMLVIWNRYGRFHEMACRYEQAGAHVVVVENGYLGKSWMGDEWFAMALGRHNGAGSWVASGPERWDELNVPMEPWRSASGPPVVLAQRGIGQEGVRMEMNWPAIAQRMYPGSRVRHHPGKSTAFAPLEQDLSNASFAITWASGAALKALLMGVPVVYGFPEWIGASACSMVPNRPVHGDRLSMFRTLIWAQWRAREIATGLPFKVLCGYV